MNALDYDPITAWLGELGRRLNLAEHEMLADGKNAFQTGATRRWWQAYLNYHCARIDVEDAKWIPCPECGGDGFKPHPETDAPTKCYECDGTGFYLCDACGEHAAVTRNEDHDALCSACAGE